VTHRLTRPVNYNQDNPAKPPQYMNLVDLDFKTANWIVLAVSLAIGLGYVAVMPARLRTTPRSNAEELGILFCLMTVASPLARQYYFLWLFFPMTILIHRAAYDPRHAVRAGTWAGWRRGFDAVVTDFKGSAGLREQPAAAAVITGYRVCMSCIRLRKALRKSVRYYSHN
jgi:hypothetical protein